MGGEGNLARLREALDDVLVVRGYGPPTYAANWYPAVEEFVALYESVGFRDVDARLIERPTPLEHGVAAWVTTFRRGWLDRAGVPEDERESHRQRGRRPRRHRHRRLCPPPLHDEEAEMMRYLPLTDADRSDMLKVIGAASVDDLFVDVPEEARLDGPIHGLPMHATEMDVERQLGALARKNMVAGEVPFFLGCGAYKHHIPA